MVAVEVVDDGVVAVSGGCVEDDSQVEVVDGSGVEVEGVSDVVVSQGVVGDAVTQLQTAVTDLATSSAGMIPQASITQPMAWP